MAGIWDQVQTFFWNIIHRPTWIDYIDILIIAFLIYQLVVITRQTRAIQVLKGLAVIIVASYASELIGLTALNWVLRSILNNGVIALLILFQPELRRALEQIGRTAKLDRSAQRDESERIVDEITQCLLRLSRRADRVRAAHGAEGYYGIQRHGHRFFDFRAAAGKHIRAQHAPA